MTVLQPGTYILDIRLARAVRTDTLGRLLGSLGFTKVVPDQMPPQDMLRIGALTASLKSPVSATSSVTTTAPRLRTTALTASPTAPKPVAATAPSVTTTAPKMRTVALHVDDPYKGGVDLRRPSPAPAAKPVSALSSYAAMAKAQAIAAPAKSFLPGGGSYGGGGGGGGGGGAAPPPLQIDRAALDAILADPNAPPDALDQLADEIEKDGFVKEAAELRARASQLRAQQAAIQAQEQRGSSASPGGGGEFVAAPPAEEALGMPSVLSQTPSPNALALLQDMWMAWKRTGNPFGRQTSVSGTGTGESKGGVVRVVARLSRPALLKDTPDLMWLRAVPLALDPFAQVASALTPHPLEQGKTYEFRVLSRTKSAPTRHAVEQMLRGMGFAVTSLSSVKKDMRFPGRPGANLVLWHGTGTWTKPNSMVVADDPLFFSEMVENAT